MGLLGVLTAMAAMATVSFVLMFPTLRLFADKEANAMAQSIMESLRPVTAGMMMAFLILLFNVENFGHPYLLKWDFVSSIFLFVATLLGVHYFRFNPISFCCFAVWPAYSFIKAGKSAPARLA